MKDRPARKKTPSRPGGVAIQKKRLKPVSLYPLDFDTAMSGFAKVSSPQVKPIKKAKR